MQDAVCSQGKPQQSPTSTTTISTITTTTTHHTGDTRDQIHNHRSPTKISRINSTEQSRQGDYASFAFETKLTAAEDQSRPDRSCSWRWTGSRHALSRLPGQSPTQHE
ncbi:uncharacterized protein LOC122818637 [Drosophila biarmipes]|uniref:uncharacterized protein LOC122818637 n=1 Tax=Drosophila biarmipes TaxID=125945 RepID=UPI001CDA8E81|nr:uncharacterized protein LOC122818637 [Drosophila biarmipes]